MKNYCSLLKVTAGHVRYTRVYISETVGLYSDIVTTCISKLVYGKWHVYCSRMAES